MSRNRSQRRHLAERCHGRRLTGKEALQRGQVGEYQVQAAIAAVHDQAACHTDTDWSEILSLYGLLERMTGNPMVRLNRAAAAMAHGPDSGLALLDGLRERLGDHRPPPFGARPPARAGRRHQDRRHRVPAAAARTKNLRERHYLTTKAARLATELADD